MIMIGAYTFPVPPHLAPVFVVCSTPLVVNCFPILTEGLGMARQAGDAGIAVKAGARSALGTLWHINDRASSVLVAEFYRQIQNPSVARAAALRQAQLKLLNDRRYQHPAYWSPFLLINNWL
jgi:CHAT domain-containing protein